jgi:hypothetical protein
MTLWGFDVLWLAALAIMIFDFGLARMFWRRAMALEAKAGERVRPRAAPMAPPARRQAEPCRRASGRHPGDAVALGAWPSSPARGGRAQLAQLLRAPLDSAGDAGLRRLVEGSASPSI